MSRVVTLPAALRDLANGRAQFEVDDSAATVNEILQAMRRKLPGVYHSLVTEQGELRPHINIFVGAEDIRSSGGLATPIGDETEIHILPAVSGG